MSEDKSMRQLTDDIDAIVQKAAIDGTLSKRAVEQFHRIITQNEETLESLRKANERNKELEERVSDLSSKYNEHMEKLSAWATREKDLKDREESCMRKEVEAEFNEKRVQDHQQMFSTVFRGIHMRKQVVTPGYPGYVDSSNMTQYGESSQVHPVTEEE